MSDRFTSEVKAYAELQSLLEHAAEVRKAFMAAGLSLPGPLARLLGADVVAASNDGVGSLDEGDPTPPQAAEKDWVWIPTTELSPQDLVLAMLRESNRPMSPAELVDEVQKTLPKTSVGTVYNIGPRLQKYVIDRNDDGWRLKDASQAPLIEGDFAWGPADVFLNQTVAVFRRSRILKLLRDLRGGLTLMQIVRMFSSSDRSPIPFTKDAIKADLERLENQGIVHRFGKNKMWQIKEGKDDPNLWNP